MNPVIDPSLTYLSGSDAIRIFELALKCNFKFGILDQIIKQIEDNNIEVVFKNLKDLNGIMVLGYEKHIFINNTRSELEQTHTLLHELGHDYLHCTNRFNCFFVCSDSFIDYQEMEADYFAFSVSNSYLKEHIRWNFLKIGARMGEKNFQ